MAETKTLVMELDTQEIFEWVDCDLDFMVLVQDADGEQKRIHISKIAILELVES